MTATNERMTQADVAAVLRMGKPKVRRLTTAGVIPSLIDPESGQVYYLRPMLDAYMRRLGEIAAERAS